MSVEHRGNDIDRIKHKYWDKSLLRYHFIHHRSHMEWMGTELGLSRWEGGEV